MLSRHACCVNAGNDPDFDLVMARVLHCCRCTCNLLPLPSHCSTASRATYAVHVCIISQPSDSIMVHTWIRGAAAASCRRLEGARQLLVDVKHAVLLPNSGGAIIMFCCCCCAQQVALQQFEVLGAGFHPHVADVAARHARQHPRTKHANVGPDIYDGAAWRSWCWWWKKGGGKRQKRRCIKQQQGQGS